nr:MAG TPA: hypothetical protein [Caudoviricetes sp.]
MRNLIKEEREHLLKLGFQFIKYEDAVQDSFRYGYEKVRLKESDEKWIEDYVMDDGTVICKPYDEDSTGYMKYSIKYLRDKGVI